VTAAAPAGDALATGALCVLTTCHELVCAIEAPSTERLALPEEVRRWQPPDGRPAPSVAIVEHNDRRYAAWNLGELLHLPPTNHAWVMLQVPHRGGVLRLALCTGPCLVVRPLTQRTALPRGLFRDRAAAIQGAFATQSIPTARSHKLGPVGYVLDVRALWTADERDASAAALAAAGEASA